MIRKETILTVKNVYTANVFGINSELYVGAGSETEQEAYLYSLSDKSTEKVDGSPGGMMSFIPVSGQPGLFVSIQGLFPPFIGKDAGLYLHQRSSPNKWTTMKAMDLPFAHRCEILCCRGEIHLFAASVSHHKDNPADWSRPGELHYLQIDEIMDTPWQSILVPGKITRNHGMAVARINNRERICISGAEGIFYVEGNGPEDWSLCQLFDRETSEMAFFDFDNDGEQELITIEPFHGDTLNIYQKKGSDWTLKFSSPLSFGHGLSCGSFNNKPTIAVGNRAGSLALETFTVEDFKSGDITRNILEENVGPTQTQVFSYNSIDYILSANQKKNEVALYKAM